MKLRLLEDHVLIREEDITKEETEKKTDSGIIVGPNPEAFEATFRGTVVEVGPDIEGINKADKVLYRQPMCDAIVVGTDKLWLGRRNAVIGVILYD